MRKGKKLMVQTIREKEELREATQGEVTQVLGRHAATKARLDEQQEIAFKEEEKARVGPGRTLFGPRSNTMLCSSPYRRRFRMRVLSKASWIQMRHYGAGRG